MTAGVVVIDSGSGNLRSVERALAAAGGEPQVTSDPEVVSKAERIFVPGQGAFGDCVSALHDRGLDQAIREVVASGRPYFGICLGLQILFEDSEESPGTHGLGLLEGQVKRFSPEVGKVPHMGWNAVRKGHTGIPMLKGIPEDTYFYFTHSYYAVPKSDQDVALRCDYGVPFVAAIQHENLFACQFHPEKSQGAGLKLLTNFFAQ
jgi:glutamine amidotransferase